jgi:VWFA-related protein
MKHRARLAILPACLLFAAPAARSQDEAPTFSTSVKVVNLFATVRGKNGEIVNNLTKDDFSITEDARPQAIRYFSRESDLPLTLGLLVDTSLSQQKVLGAERSASMQFLEQVLRENQDRVFITQFDMAVVMRQKLTSSRRELSESLAYVDTPEHSDLVLQRGAGTRLYDAVLQASKDVMNNQQNRKALIILSDGVDTGSDANITAAIEAAQRADTLIYSILFSDEGYYGFGPFGASHNGKNALMRLARETGGSFFEVTKKLGLDQIFDMLQEELRSQYSLGFVSDVPVRISEFRKLQLTVKQKNLAVKSRDRYWAKR